MVSWMITSYITLLVIIFMCCAKLLAFSIWVQMLSVLLVQLHHHMKIEGARSLPVADKEVHT